MAIKLGDEVAVPANVLADLEPRINPHKAVEIAHGVMRGGGHSVGVWVDQKALFQFTGADEKLGDAAAVLLIHKTNAYNALVVTLQNLLRECEVAAVDLRPRRAGPMRAKMRHARQVLDDIGEADV